MPFASLLIVGVVLRSGGKGVDQGFSGERGTGTVETAEGRPVAVTRDGPPPGHGEVPVRFDRDRRIRLGTPGVGIDSDFSSDFRPRGIEALNKDALAVASPVTVPGDHKIAAIISADDRVTLKARGCRVD